MSTDLQDYVRRPKQYDNIDGTGEIAFGIMGLGFTLMMYLESVVPRQYGMWVLYGVMLPMCGLILWVPRLIKTHITWPRTGYVRLGPSPEARWSRRTWLVVIFVTSALVGAGVTVLAFSSREPLRMLLMGNPVVYAVCYVLWIWFMERRHPWKWLVAALMLIGLLAIVLIVPAGFKPLSVLMLLFVGLMWLASGGATLYLYIRNTTPPAADIE